MAWAKYGEAKEHEGKKYRGMRVGGIHRWSYPDGTWKERKVTPSDWDIVFTSHKHRLRKAPKGSGAETGSQYHWLIVADQWVEKLDENTYTTVMEGKKFLVSFKKPEWPVWNTQFRNQKPAREKVIKLLEAYLARLKDETANIENPWDAETFEELALPKAEKEPSGQIVLTLAEKAKSEPKRRRGRRTSSRRRPAARVSRTKR